MKSPSFLLCAHGAHYVRPLHILVHFPLQRPCLHAWFSFFVHIVSIMCSLFLSFFFMLQIRISDLGFWIPDLRSGIRIWNPDLGSGFQMGAPSIKRALFCIPPPMLFLYAHRAFLSPFDPQEPCMGSFFFLHVPSVFLLILCSFHALFLPCRALWKSGLGACFPEGALCPFWSFSTGYVVLQPF